MHGPYLERRIDNMPMNSGAEDKGEALEKRFDLVDSFDKCGAGRNHASIYLIPRPEEKGS